jgi:hypothetical protein
LGGFGRVCGGRRRSRICLVFEEEAFLENKNTMLIRFYCVSFVLILRN